MEFRQELRVTDGKTGKKIIHDNFLISLFAPSPTQHYVINNTIKMFPNVLPKQRGGGKGKDFSSLNSFPTLSIQIAHKGCVQIDFTRFQGSDLTHTQKSLKQSILEFCIFSEKEGGKEMVVVLYKYNPAKQNVLKV